MLYKIFTGKYKPSYMTITKKNTRLSIFFGLLSQMDRIMVNFRCSV